MVFLPSLISTLSNQTVLFCFPMNTAGGQIAECSFSSAKISNIPVTSKYLAGYFILFSIKTSI